MTEQIELHIQQLVICGVPDAEHELEIAALREELVRCVRRHGFPGFSSTALLADQGPLEVVLPASWGSGDIGRLSAQAMYRGLHERRSHIRDVAVMP